MYDSSRIFEPGVERRLNIDHQVVLDIRKTFLESGLVTDQLRLMFKICLDNLMDDKHECWDYQFLSSVLTIRRSLSPKQIAQVDRIVFRDIQIYEDLKMFNRF